MRIYTVRSEDVPLPSRSIGSEHPVRDAQIVRMHRAGLRGSEIAREFGITRERVRQIVLRDTGESVGKIRGRECGICSGRWFGRSGRRAHNATPQHRAAREAKRVEHFWSRVVKSPSCWTWTGSRNEATGYCACNMRVEGGGGYAHRVAYILAKGPIPAGLSIDHLCRNRGCVNPDHLEAVSHRENILRSPNALAAINAAKTHCPQGHPYSGSNLRLSADGRSRVCRTCGNERSRVGYRRRRRAGMAA